MSKEQEKKDYEKVAVVGCRKVKAGDLSWVFGKLEQEASDVHIITGDAEGIDSCARIHAKDYKLPITIFYAVLCALAWAEKELEENSDFEFTNQNHQASSAYVYAIEILKKAFGEIRNE